MFLLSSGSHSNLTVTHFLQLLTSLGSITDGILPQKEKRRNYLFILNWFTLINQEGNYGCEFWWQRGEEEEELISISNRLWCPAAISSLTEHVGPRSVNWTWIKTSLWLTPSKGQDLSYWRPRKPQTKRLRPGVRGKGRLCEHASATVQVVAMKELKQGWENVCQSQ